MEEIMSNQDYWQQRAERNLQAVEDIAVDYNLELAKEYKKVIKEHPISGIFQLENKNGRYLFSQHNR